MGLKDDIMAAVKVAMKSKDQERLSTLRFVHSEIKNCEIDMRPKEISEDDIVGVIKKLAKQRKDSIQQFKDAGRDDLVAKEEAELKILAEYLPEPMSREQVEAIVSEVISSMNATSMKQMGAVMKEVMAKTSGAADNKVVSDVVRAKLQ